MSSAEYWQWPAAPGRRTVPVAVIDTFQPIQIGEKQHQLPPRPVGDLQLLLRQG